MKSNKKSIRQTLHVLLVWDSTDQCLDVVVFQMMTERQIDRTQVLSTR
jgi:hypothetical protein